MILVKGVKALNTVNVVSWAAANLNCKMVVTSVPDLAIYWTLGKFLKPLATIKLAKSPTILGNFWKGVKSDHFSREIIFG